MVSLAGLPENFRRLLLANFDFIEHPSYMQEQSPHRFLDFYEMFSGEAHLTRGVEAVSCLQTV